MQSSLKFSFAMLILASWLFLWGPSAHADTITLTLANPIQFTGTGGTFSFVATVSAPSTNSGVENLNGAMFQVPAPATLDDSGYLNYFPLDLAAGDSYTGELFSVFVPTSALPNLYSGTFSITGGADSSSDAVLATVTYGVNVTPEPATWLLLGTGLAGLAFLMWWKRAPLTERSPLTLTERN